MENNHSKENLVNTLTRPNNNHNVVMQAAIIVVNWKKASK